MWKLSWFGGYNSESGWVCPSGDERFIIEKWAGDGELERFVIPPTDDKGGVQELLELEDQTASEFVLILYGGEVSGPVCVDVSQDVLLGGFFCDGKSMVSGP